jgi:hypothetical protein
MMGILRKVKRGKGERSEAKRECDQYRAIRKKGFAELLANVVSGRFFLAKEIDYRRLRLDDDGEIEGLIGKDEKFYPVEKETEKSELCKRFRRDMLLFVAMSVGLAFAIPLLYAAQLVAIAGAVGVVFLAAVGLDIIFNILEHKTKSKAFFYLKYGFVLGFGVFLYFLYKSDFVIMFAGLLLFANALFDYFFTVGGGVLQAIRCDLIDFYRLLTNDPDQEFWIVAIRYDESQSQKGER